MRKAVASARALIARAIHLISQRSNPAHQPRERHSDCTPWLIAVDQAIWEIGRMKLRSEHPLMVRTRELRRVYLGTSLEVKPDCENAGGERGWGVTDGDNSPYGEHVFKTHQEAQALLDHWVNEFALTGDYART